MSLIHLCSQINANSQLRSPPQIGAEAALATMKEYHVDSTQQAHFQWLLSLAQARSGLAELNLSHPLTDEMELDETSRGETNRCAFTDRNNGLATPPPKPLAASHARVNAMQHSASALASGDIANMRLLQLLQPHPLSLRNNPDYIDDDVLNNGVFLREQVTLPSQILQPELLHELYAKHVTESVKP